MAAPASLLRGALCAICVAGVLSSPLPLSAQEKVQRLPVVATLPHLAEVAQAVGGELVTVSTLSPPGVDPHAIDLTPAMSGRVRDAQLFIANGMQLEGWAIPLLSAAGRELLNPGQAGHVYATNGVLAREIPTESELSGGGHVHAAGNPHVWLDPLNLIEAARNIEAGLARRLPTEKATFAKNRIAFEKRMDALMFGEELPKLMGGRHLRKLHRTGRLIAFLEKQQLGGTPLIDKLGGWLARARALGTLRVFAYHGTWSYFAQSFGFEVVDTLEEKPGIPPGPARLNRMVERAASDKVSIAIAAAYYPETRLAGFAERISGRALMLPTQPGEVPNSDTLPAMFDRIFDALEGAAQGGS